MSPPGPVIQRARFVHGATGSRFRLVTEPADRQPIGTVVAAHAFAEEMNKSRRMCARLARLLAGAGWRVVQKDLLGCGDSAGDFADASWAAWQLDLEDEVASCDAAAPLWLWGHRAGALLAAAAVVRRPDANLLLWQPVSSGAQHLQQFLRLHAGARIVGSGKAGDTTSPAQRLRAGQAVEVAGYELSPALASGMEQANFDLPDGCTGRIVWLEVSDHDVPALSPAATRAIDRLQARQIGVEAEAMRGPAFWQTQEIEECEVLLERSLAAVANSPQWIFRGSLASAPAA
jgi:uncharacterized protein